MLISIGMRRTDYDWISTLPTDVFSEFVRMLPVTCCVALACINKATHSRKMIELLKERLAIRIHSSNVYKCYNNNLTLSFDPYYVRLIPHWRMNVKCVSIHRFSRERVTISISSTLGSFVQVGQFLWNKDVQLYYLAVNRLLQSLTNNDELVERMSNAEFQAAFNTHCVFFSWTGMYALHKYGACILDNVVHGAHKRTTYMGMKVTLDIDMSMPRKPVRMGEAAKYKCAMLDGKDNSPFVVGLKVNINTCNMPHHHKDALENITDAMSVCAIGMSTVSTLASFGIGHIAAPYYASKDELVASKMSAIIDEVLKMSDHARPFMDPRRRYQVSHEFEQHACVFG